MYTGTTKGGIYNYAAQEKKTVVIQWRLITSPGIARCTGTVYISFIEITDMVTFIHCMIYTYLYQYTNA